MAQPIINPLASLQRASAAAVRGVPVGGLWRLRDNRLEIQRFGGNWGQVPPEQLRKGPQGLLLWQEKVALAPG